MNRKEAEKIADERISLWKEYLKYDEESPSHLTWIKRPAYNVKVGSHAGTYKGNEYYRVRLHKKNIMAHIIIACILSLPLARESLIRRIIDPKDNTLVIDHKDTNRFNNNILNLKVKTNRENLQNKKMHHEGHLIGATFVNTSKLAKPWRASIEYKRRGLYLGMYKTPEEASEAYWKAVELIGEDLTPKELQIKVRAYMQKDK